MITKKSLVLGLVVLALLAAIPTLYDNVTTSLSGMTQTIVGNKTFDSKQTRFLDSSSSTKVSLSNANPANTTTLIVSSAKLNSTTVILSAPSTPAPSPGPQVIANITFRDPTLGGTIDGIAGGESQDGKGNYGGYILLNTTRFGVSGNQLEAVQAVPNGHVGMPQDIRGENAERMRGAGDVRDVCSTQLYLPLCQLQRWCRRADMLRAEHSGHYRAQDDLGRECLDRLLDRSDLQLRSADGDNGRSQP